MRWGSLGLQTVYFGWNVQREKPRTEKVSTLIAFLYRYSLICLVTPGTLIVARTLGAEKKSTLVGMMRDFGGKSRTVEGSCR